VLREEQLSNQSINQIHSQNRSHSHQLHTPQSDIAPSPNLHWMMHGGEASHQTATKDKVGAAEARKAV
jgi:hypothetical protein